LIAPNRQPNIFVTSPCGVSGASEPGKDLRQLSLNDSLQLTLMFAPKDRPGSD